MKWQYQIMTVVNPPKADDIQDTLNLWGSEGWELISIEGKFLAEDGHALVFKRPIHDSNQ